MSLVKCCLHLNLYKKYPFHLMVHFPSIPEKNWWFQIEININDLEICQGIKNILWHLVQLDITSAQGIMWHCWQRFLWKGITTFHPINLGDIKKGKVLLWHGFIIFFFIVVCHFCYWGSYHKKTWMILCNFALFFFCSVHKTEWSPLIMMRVKTLKQKLSLLN